MTAIRKIVNSIHLTWLEDVLLLPLEVLWQSETTENFDIVQICVSIYIYIYIYIY